MKESDIESRLRNSVYHWIRGQHQDAPHSNTSESFFKKAHIQWEKRIHKSLNSMCTELGIHLARLRYPNDRDELIEKWGELSNYDVGKILYFHYYYKLTNYMDLLKYKFIIK